MIGSAEAGEFDTALATAAYGGLAIDWLQTRYIAAHAEQFQETNRMLGQHPSMGRVDAYFACGIAGIAVVSQVLPTPARRWFLGNVATLEFAVLAGNRRIGIGMQF